MRAAAVFCVLGAVAAADQLFDRIEQRLSSLARAYNVSDHQLQLPDLRTFVSDNGRRRNKDEHKHQALRARTPPPIRLKERTLNLMRQSLYSAQNRILEVQPILQSYSDDPSLRMSFILRRLKQLILDIKRVYTLAARRTVRNRLLNHMVFYSHCARKFIDILYTVDFAIVSHDAYMKKHGSEIPREFLNAKMKPHKSG